MSRPAVHPGEILADKLLELGISGTELARQLGLPKMRVTHVIAGKQAITGDTALRLGHWYGNSAEFCLNLQAAFDIRAASTDVGALLPPKDGR